MNPNRLHNRESFYKHTSASTARTILAGCSLRWSMPGRFNDPFDVPTELWDGFDEGALIDAFIRRFNSLVMSPVPLELENFSPMARLILAATAVYNDAEKAELIAANGELRGQRLKFRHNLEEMRQHWRETYRDWRVLCLAERWDSASMWDRYSDGHKGVLLELGCSDELDSAWLRAKPVRYTEEALHYNTVGGLAELMVYDACYATARIFEEYTHTKTTDWSAEREWRIVSAKRSQETGDFSDYKFLPEELTGLTFGALAEASEKAEILSLLEANFPHAEVWQASIRAGRRMTRTRIRQRYPARFVAWRAGVPSGQQ